MSGSGCLKEMFTARLFSLSSFAVCFDCYDSKFVKDS